MNNDAWVCIKLWHAIELHSFHVTCCHLHPCALIDSKRKALCVKLSWSRVPILWRKICAVSRPHQS